MYGKAATISTAGASAAVLPQLGSNLMMNNLLTFIGISLLTVLFVSQIILIIKKSK